MSSATRVGGARPVPTGTVPHEAERAAAAAHTPAQRVGATRRGRAHRDRDDGVAHHRRRQTGPRSRGHAARGNLWIWCQLRKTRRTTDVGTPGGKARAHLTTTASPYDSLAPIDDPARAPAALRAGTGGQDLLSHQTRALLWGRGTQVSSIALGPALGCASALLAPKSSERPADLRQTRSSSRSVASPN